MVAEFIMVDANGNPSKTGPNAKMNICDSSYSPYVCRNNVIVPMPTQYGCNNGTNVYVGEAADWVFERYGTFRLANFGTSTMTYNFATMADKNSSSTCSGASLGSPGAQYTNWYLYGSPNCGGNLLATSAIGNPESHGVDIVMTYYNYQ